MNKLQTMLRRFRSERKGSTAISLGLTFTMVTGATFGALEYEQGQRVRAQMQDKLDSALLYLGANGSENVQAEGVNYLTNAIAASELPVKSFQATFKRDGFTGTTEGTVSFEMDSIFGNLSIGNVTMEVEAKAEPKIEGDVEISLVLDVSGSMGWGFDDDQPAAVGERRIDAMFEAADSMFQAIYRNPRVTPAVGVVPYATSVDITDPFSRRSRSQKDDEYVLFNEEDDDIDEAAIMPLLLNNLPIIADDADATLEDLDDDYLTVRDHDMIQTVWAAERHKGQRSNGTYKLMLNRPQSNQDREVPVITQNYFSPASSGEWCNALYLDWFGSECIDVVGFNGYYNSDGSASRYAGSGLLPKHGILPMTTDSQAVRDYVASFEPSGGTAGHIGMEWGSYMLTPWWDSTFDHPAGKPQKFQDTEEKYLVFMTDGQFNSQKDPDMDEAEMYQYFQGFCSMMRSRGVKIFTVGLLLNETTETELSKCAGSTGKFYSVHDRLGLVEAFVDVGREAGELRLSY